MGIKLDYQEKFHKSLGHRSNYPIITNVAISSTGLVTWTTDIPSTSQVHYGTTPNLGPLSDFDGTLVTSHSVQLSGLSNNVQYYLRVQSFYLDALSISDLYAFVVTSATQPGVALEDGSGVILMEDGTRIQLES